MRTNLLIFAIAVAFSLSSFGAEWVPTGRNEEIRAFDASRTRMVQPNIVRTWKRYRLENHASPQYNVSITEWEIDCLEMRHRMMSVFDYTTDGRILNSFAATGEFRSIPPESVGDTEARLICQYARQNIRK